jgi:hypothetical protein
MRPNTWERRTVAACALATGLMVEGAVGMPASVAISAMLNWSSVLPKYTSAAAATP